ncbi:MAG: TolC family protein [Bryobacteraceae bacterium]
MQERLSASRAAAAAVTLAALLHGLAPAARGQTAARIEPPKGGWGALTRPYQARSAPPIQLVNSPRLESLIRAGNLYLSAQDVIALAIENNLDVEVQRYGPLLAREVLKRAEAGGVLRSVGAPVAPGPRSVSLQGVSTAVGAVAAGAGVGSGGGILTQLGPPIPSLDPSVTAVAFFSHQTTPQSNTVLTGTTSLVQDARVYQLQYSQNWATGTSAQLGYSSQRLKVNSLFFSLNPFTQASLDLQVTQNLLQGFGRSVNMRNILVQRNNLKVSDLQFRLQLIETVSSALNLYWDLVSFHYEVRARQQAVETAQKLLNDNRRMVELGTLAEIEVTRAEAQLYAARQDLVVAQTNLMQQEVILKNALSRTGVASPELAAVRIVPLDTMVKPDDEPLPDLEKLVSEALEKRAEIQQSRLNLESNRMNLAGIKSSLRPSLQAFAQLTNNALTGDLTTFGAVAGVPEIFVGGYGNLWKQILRRKFPNYSAGFSLNIPLRNRAAQSDYAASLLEIRQNELLLQKNINQIRVDVQNAVIGLEQARARYEAAVKARELAEATLRADQKKYELGATTAFQIVQDQRDLAAAQSAEVQAMANYSHAKIALDQALGRTLEVHRISVEEALRGEMTGIQSKAPEEVRR